MNKKVKTHIGTEKHPMNVRWFEYESLVEDAMIASDENGKVGVATVYDLLRQAYYLGLKHGEQPE